MIQALLTYFHCLPINILAEYKQFACSAILINKNCRCLNATSQGHFVKYIFLSNIVNGKVCFPIERKLTEQNPTIIRIKLNFTIFFIESSKEQIKSNGKNYFIIVQLLCR